MAATKLLSITVLVLAVASASATARVTANDQLNALYSRQKVFESCLGVANVRSYNDRLRVARTTCQGIPPREKLDEPKSEGSFDYSLNQVSGAQSYFTEDTVRYLSERMMAKVSNMTCVLRQMGFMDNEDNVNYDALVMEVSTTPGLDDQLRIDLIKGISDCKAMAICLPIDEISFPITPALLRWSNFSKCKVSQDYQACLKKDLRARSEEFQLDGLGNFLNNYSDSDKMFAVVWARNVLDEGSDFLW